MSERTGGQIEVHRAMRKDLRLLHETALAAVDPYGAVKRVLDGPADPASLGNDFRRIVVVGAGKATARMALAVEDTVGDRITEGVIVVKHGHTARLSRIRQVEASHPVPDEDGVRGTGEVLDAVRSSDSRTLVLCLLSGGGSALLVAPAQGLSLSDKQVVTDLLLKAGASIEELNAVRKHLSAIKGGRLACEAYPAAVRTLILSDVIGDRLDVIASGPTVPDSSTFADALAVIEKYRLRSAIPPRVDAFLVRGLGGQEPETIKEGDACFGSVRNVIVGSNRQALAAAKERAHVLGYTASIMTDALRGDARSAAREMAARALREQERLPPSGRLCLLAGGETTIVVQGTGRGGRNQEMALAFALGIAGREGICFLAAGSDGTDGPTDAAGAFIDGMTVTSARLHGLEPANYLANNDSYGFFQRYDRATGQHDHLMTGPTGTNVMDLMYVLVEGRNKKNGT
jgi:hydroxypyruvate reductase